MESGVILLQWKTMKKQVQRQRRRPVLYWSLWFSWFLRPSSMYPWSSHSLDTQPFLEFCELIHSLFCLNQFKWGFWCVQPKLLTNMIAAMPRILQGRWQTNIIHAAPKNWFCEELRTAFIPCWLWLTVTISQKDESWEKEQKYSKQHSWPSCWRRGRNLGTGLVSGPLSSCVIMPKLSREEVFRKE